MFELIKEKVSLEQVMADISQITLKEAGEWSEPEDVTCPFCGHRDCFKVNPEKDRYQCFSCEASGDVIGYVAAIYKVSNFEAAQAIVKQYNLEIPSGYSVVREITRLASDYYHNCMMTETRTFKELAGMTPLEYQEKVRGHDKGTVERFKIGWSDGGLIAYLESLGFDQEDIEATGLVNKKGNDFLPRKSFIYPHMVGSAVGHFTFKDPTKQAEYQVAKKFRHNQWGFYNQNSIIGAHTVIVEEGENDVISTAQRVPDGYGVLGCIGMISGEQLEWLAEKCHDKNIITIFDPDDAGVKYQDKLKRIGGRVLSLKQVDLPRHENPEESKDIDDLLRGGASLVDILATARVDSEQGAKPTVELKASDGSVEAIEVDTEEASQTGTIVEHHNAYYRIRYKDGVPTKFKLTNFVVQLKNIYIQADRREREVIFVREDGKRSKPVTVSSEVKVSLKSFKSLVANAVDASFYGREDDLALLWDFVYQGISEKEVYLPSTVGHMRDFNGWLFRECFVGDDGSIYSMDSDGVIWLNGSSSAGIKPMNLTDMDDGSTDNIPDVVTDLDAESRKDLEKDFVQNFAENLGDIGIAVTALGWAKSCAYSDKLFDWRRDFPFLFLWGRHGRGKTYVAKWLAGLYGTSDNGYTTMSGMKKSVGFYRKLAYYASLPVVIDEVRADRDTIEMYGTFRAWYQRSGRTLGTKEAFGIREQRVLSTFIFAGQDQFTDSALRQRCIPIRIPIANRELEKTFNWIEGNRYDLSAIGLGWILESSKVDFDEVRERIKELNIYLRDAGCPQRTSLNWALIAEFGRQIATEHFPGFDFVDYVLKASMEDTEEQESDDILAQFFQVVEGLQAAEMAKITSAHVSATGENELSIWMSEVFRIVEKELTHTVREEFSKKAIMGLLREEPWCIHKDGSNNLPRSIMGDGVQRRVFKFDLRECPEYIKVLAEYSVRKS